MRVCALAILFFAAIAAVNCEVFYEENFKDGRFFFVCFRRLFLSTSLCGCDF